MFPRVHGGEMGGKERKEPGVRVLLALAPSSVPPEGSLLGGSRVAGP